MKELLISVIVPVYNVEPYIRKCIESIQNQTYKNLEIILVDDGSTDGSGITCDEYAAKDKRIRVIHKKNGGLSDARNAGLEICNGDFIGFVDSDDYIADDMYETLYDFAMKNNLDVAMCSNYLVFGDKFVKCKFYKPKIIEDKYSIIEDIFVNKQGVSAIGVCNKLFKKNVLENLNFDKGKAYEDVFFALKWIEKTDRFGKIYKNSYFYIQRENSITHQKIFSEKILDGVVGYYENLNIIKRKYPKNIEHGEYRFFWSCKCTIVSLSECYDYRSGRCLEAIKELQKILRENAYNIFKNRCFKTNEKIACFFIMINFNLFVFCKNIYRRIKNEKVHC